MIIPCQKLDVMRINGSKMGIGCRRTYIRTSPLHEPKVLIFCSHVSQFCLAFSFLSGRKGRIQSEGRRGQPKHDVQQCVLVRCCQRIVQSRPESPRLDTMTDGEKRRYHHQPRSERVALEQLFGEASDDLVGRGLLRPREDVLDRGLWLWFGGEVSVSTGWSLEFPTIVDPYGMSWDPSLTFWIGNKIPQICFKKRLLELFGQDAIEEGV